MSQAYDAKTLLLKSFKITHLDIMNADGEHYIEITYLNNDACNEWLKRQPQYIVAFNNCCTEHGIKNTKTCEVAYYLTNHLLVCPCFQLERHMPDVFNHKGWPSEDCVKMPDLWHCWTAFYTTIATFCVNNPHIPHDDFNDLMVAFRGDSFESIRVDFFQQLENVRENIKSGTGEKQLNSRYISNFFTEIKNKL
jgi:hypothetical protein